MTIFKSSEGCLIKFNDLQAIIKKLMALKKIHIFFQKLGSAFCQI